MQRTWEAPSTETGHLRGYGCCLSHSLLLVALLSPCLTSHFKRNIKIFIMGQLKRMDARTYIHERWASRTWPANMFKLYICTH